MLSIAASAFLTFVYSPDMYRQKKWKKIEGLITTSNCDLNLTLNTDCWYLLGYKL